ncbi:hypothetical protein DSL64_06000 [Dyadobacter luteus]|uniref:Sialate O-acetylesterase domain-containing protein n=1 Tax=Dyadobacter luteus TaxID=2259619 RepID=A0A3D8YEY7_9BACT|nr:sialate O-acetylesterase [Dyadobacter luteus]REA63166.1 hypothetical protein DSL64_06000 [Dyadobacter luteus]
MKIKFSEVWNQSIFLFTALFFIHLYNDASAEKIQFINFNKLPQDYQLYPRDEKNEANIPVSGFVERSGYSYVSVIVYRNETLVQYLRSPINYTERGSFGTSAKIKAELADYRFKVYVCKTGDSTLIADRQNVVSGDAYLLTGQSNSTGFFTEKQTNKYCRSFGKITGNLNTDTYNPADTLWALSNQENSGALVGTMGLEMQRQLVEISGVPNCLINGGFHWSSAESHSRRTEGNPADMNNGYGRMLYRAQKAGLTRAVRGLVFRQGETEAYHEGSNWEGYFDLFRKNLYIDYPNLQKLYVFQIDIIYYNSPIGAIVRDYQRRLPQIYPDVSSIASVGTTGYDGLHYSREGNIQSGQEVARLMARDFYQRKDTLNINSPNVQKAFYSSNENNRLIITFDENQELLYPEAYKPEYADGILQMKDFFYLGGGTGAVLSGTAEGNRIILELNGKQSAREFNYLPNYIEAAAPYFRYTGPYLKNKLGMRAFSFFQMPIGDALSSPALEARPGTDHDVILTWSGVPGANSYVLERRTNPESTYKSVAILPSPTRTYRDNIVPGGQRLQYRIKAVNTTAESAEFGNAEIMTDIILGTQKEVNQLFFVYPNPSHSREGVMVHFARPSSGKISILSQSGNLLGVETINQQTTVKLKTTIPGQGFYLIRYESGTQSYVSGIIVK